MKICPTCRKSYADDNLNFCLEDGSVLTLTSSEPPPTVMMSQPRPTDPASSFPTQSQGIQSSFGNPPQYSMQQPPKKSKAWLWIVGIVGILLLLCGGGFVGLVLIGMNAERNQANNNSTYPGNVNGSRTSPSPGASPFSSTTTTTGDVTPIDVSMFVKEFSAFGTTEMSGDELIMAAKLKGYYYVLVATDDYSTLDSITRVTVRNPDNADSRLGYGLIFHSDPKPLTNGFAFLIDAKKKRYRIVQHSTSTEKSVVAWKTSSAIKDGTQENALEIRDKGDSVEFYINDQMVTTTKDSFTGSTGVPGLYSGDGVKVAFKKMEISK
jgi:hypothetical protein